VGIHELKHHKYKIRAPTHVSLPEIIQFGLIFKKKCLTLKMGGEILPSINVNTPVEQKYI
jgi:hypothetical protein